MKRYLNIFVLLLVTEIAIAVFHFHKIIRGFIGDVLVIPLLYTLIRWALKWKVRTALLTVLGIAFTIEFLQLLQLNEIFGFQGTVTELILGTTFDVMDLMAYGIGALIIWGFERKITQGTD